MRTETERGRFAPSPTGELHLGNARTALLAWLWARSVGGRFTMRVEDLDRPRVREGLAARQLDELRWLGLDWDEGPSPEEAGKERGPHGPYLQSRRGPLYDAAIQRLRAAGAVYECFCSRTEIALASAPHGAAEEGPRYPGTCRELGAVERARRRAARVPAIRVRVPEGPISFVDALAGPQSFDVQAQTGDFVLRRADGVIAYQLAVVVDDAAMEITQVLRGKDLLPSTSRQLLLHRLLGNEAPVFAHAPLVLFDDGRGTSSRLSKRDRSLSLSALRSAGADRRRLIGLLGQISGLLPGPSMPPSVDPRSLASAPACTPADLVPLFHLAKVPAEPAFLRGAVESA